MDLKNVKQEPRLKFERGGPAPPSSAPSGSRRQRKATQRQFRAANKADTAVMKAERAALKADRAEAKLPQKAVRRLYFDKDAGKVTTRLLFRSKKPPSNLGSAPSGKVAAATGAGLHSAANILNAQGEMDETSTALFEQTAQAGAGGVHAARTGAHDLRQLNRTVRRHPYQKAARAEKRLARKNRKALVRQAQAENPTSNPISRIMQKRRVKQQYAIRFREKAWGRGAKETAALSWRKNGLGIRATLKRKKSENIARALRVLKILLPIILGVVLLLELLSACGLLFAGESGAAQLGAYQASDDDIYAAEAAYCQMEADLQNRLDNYEAEHDYDEYHFELDELGHDPYVLISLVSSLHDGPWTLEDVRPTLELIFAQQYILTEEIVEEIREETTEPTDPTPTDPEPTQPPPTPRPPGPTPQPQSEDNATDDGSGSTVYTICTVTLVNFDLSHVPVYMLNESQLSRYSVYMSSLGCRPELFPDSVYVERYGLGNYMDYAIPTEALEDEVFAAMMLEARKYLGYPYVWGGSTPSTSFDCSGYVSWVINHTIVNGEPYWGDIGRRGASALYSYCTPTSTPHPGDLVFFEYTYTATPQPVCTHVGIYVGLNPDNGHPMMLHCGDPISFADLSSSYWQEHLYGYGKLP